MTDVSTTGEHVRGITEEMAALIREEVARVRDETMASARAASVDLALAAGAGAAGLAGVVAGTIAAIDGLHGGTAAEGRGLPLWLAAGAVSALAGGAAFTLLRVALRDLRERSVAPREAIGEIGQAAGAVRDQLRAGTA